MVVLVLTIKIVDATVDVKNSWKIAFDWWLLKYMASFIVADWNNFAKLKAKVSNLSNSVERLTLSLILCSELEAMVWVLWLNALKTMPE